jgi:hypothetical protein
MEVDERKQVRKYTHSVTILGRSFLFIKLSLKPKSLNVFFSFLGWNGTEFTFTEANTGPLYQLRMMIDDDECGAFGGIIGRENPTHLEETCPSAALSTTNPIGPYPGSNPGRRGGKPATDRPSLGTATGKIT